MTEDEIRRLAVLARDIAKDVIPVSLSNDQQHLQVVYLEGRNLITPEIFKELVRSSYLGHIVEKINKSDE